MFVVQSTLAPARNVPSPFTNKRPFFCIWASWELVMTEDCCSHRLTFREGEGSWYCNVACWVACFPEKWIRVSLSTYWSEEFDISGADGTTNGTPQAPQALQAAMTLDEILMFECLKNLGSLSKCLSCASRGSSCVWCHEGKMSTGNLDEVSS